MEINSVPGGAMPTPRRWLITGGCGFIGRNLVKNLLDENDHHIRIVDNLSTGTRKDLAQIQHFTELDPDSLQETASKKQPTRDIEAIPSTVELIVADILDADLAVQAAQGMDVIVHLAANTGVAPSVENPHSDCMNNVIGTLNYLEAARQMDIKKFIFASSSAPVGECEPPIHEDIAPHPVSPYGASKLAGEGYCSAYQQTFGVQTVALRFGNVYGPLSTRKDSVVAKFINRAMQGKPLEFYGDGTQTRDFIYVDDLVRAIKLAAVANKTAGGIFQIASNTETTIGQLAEILILILAKYGIDNIQIQLEAPRPGEVKRSFSNTSKAAQILGWRSEIDLREGLNRTVRWYLEGQ